MRISVVLLVCGVLCRMVFSVIVVWVIGIFFLVLSYVVIWFGLKVGKV